jgi:ferredoxin/flavodoxin---NADP+ reductase
MSPDTANPPQLIPTPLATLADVAIVGGGPVGLFATFYAGMRQMSVILIDSLQQLGGQLATLYPEKLIYDVAGYPKVLAKDLSASLVKQAMFANPVLALGEQVNTLEWDDHVRCFTIRTDKAAHPARTVIIAAGVGAMVPKRLPLGNASQFEGRGLYYAVQDPQTFRDRRVLIVGGGDSAVDWANALSLIARQLVLIHRRDVFRAHEANVSQMRASLTDIRTFHELRSLVGESTVRQAVIEDTRSRRTTTLDVDAVLVNIGFESSLGPIRDWGLALEGNGIRVEPTMQTSRPGVFAVGDVCAYPAKLKLLATGFGEAVTAVNFAKKFIDPSANPFPGHSTSVAEQRMPGLTKE